MGTRFNPAGSSDEIAFDTDGDAFRAFRATLIHVATADKASEIRYRLDGQHERLLSKIEDDEHVAAQRHE
jgi:hypothetical protein